MLSKKQERKCFYLLLFCFYLCFCDLTKGSEALNESSFEKSLQTIRVALGNRSPNCFICRAWEEEVNHSNNTFVIKLRNDLVSAGITAILDLHDLRVGDSIDDYITHISKNDFFVITIFTPTFYDRVAQNQGWLYQEVCLVKKRLENSDGFFYIPILLEGDEQSSIPRDLRPYNRLYMNFQKNDNYNSNVLEIIRDKFLNKNKLYDNYFQCSLRCFSNFCNRFLFVLPVIVSFLYNIQYIEVNMLPKCSQNMYMAPIYQFSSYQLAYLAEEGHFLMPQNHTKSIEFFKFSAECGDSKSKLHLAQRYEHYKYDDEAIALYYQLTEMGYPLATEKLSKLSKRKKRENFLEMLSAYKIKSSVAASDGDDFGFCEDIKRTIRLIYDNKGERTLYYLMPLCIFDDIGATFLSEALKENSVLETLNFSFNDVTDSGLVALSEALEVNKGLQEITIRCEFRHEGIIALANALKKNRTLKKLRISLRHISDEDTLLFFNALQTNFGLEELHINLNPTRPSNASILSM